MADAGTIELVKLIGGGTGLTAFCTFVAMQLRDQTRLLVSINRKQARIEVALAIAAPERPRDHRARTSPIGVPVREPQDSDEPPNIPRTTTDG